MTLGPTAPVTREPKVKSLLISTAATGNRTNGWRLLISTSSLFRTRNEAENQRTFRSFLRRIAAEAAAEYEKIGGAARGRELDGKLRF